MKTVILSAAILGILTGGILYYAQHKQTNRTITIENSKKNAPALTYDIPVKHPSWKDVLVPVKNETGRVQRKGVNDYATILELKPDSITIAWDNWGTETFVKQQDGTYTLKK